MKSKKVKITLTIILALFFNFPLFSQDIEVHLGNKEKVKALEKIESTFLTKDGAIAIKTKSIQFQLLPGTKMLGSTDYSMEVLDKNMNIVSQNELELPDKNLNIVEIAYVNEELYVFMEKYDSKSDLNSLYGTTISNTGEFNQDIFEIVQIRSETKRDANQFEIDLSVDSTQFLITMSPQRSDRNQVAERQFLIINHKFEEIDNIKVDFPFKERDFEIDNKLLDHHGNIHLLCAISIDETRRVNIFNTEAEKEASVFSIYKG